MKRLLIVEANSICFGCMKARDLRGCDASIILYENLYTRYVDIVPRTGDVLLCYLLHSSVHLPICRLKPELLCLRQLPIPCDVLQHYFPLLERLRRRRAASFSDIESLHEEALS